MFYSLLVTINKHKEIDFIDLYIHTMIAVVIAMCSFIVIKLKLLISLL